MTRTGIAKEIAAALLEIEAVFLRPENPFTWTSGIKSPIYCDNRITLSHPKVRNLIEDSFVQVIKENYSDTEVIAGVATAGIAHAAIVAEKLALPMIYVRSSSKGHGRENQIEGKLNPGQKVILIEDLISTAGSSLAAADVIKEAGANLNAMLAIFTYGLAKADKNISASGVEALALSNYDALIEVALEKNIIKESDLETLKEWRKDPGAWGLN